MKDIEVEELLRRFMDGETSLEEETALAEYFRGAGGDDRPDSIPEEDWEAYREMFRMFEDGYIGVRVSHPHITETGRGRDAHAPRGIRIDLKPSGLRIYMAVAAVAAYPVGCAFILRRQRRWRLSLYWSLCLMSAGRKASR